MPAEGSAAAQKPEPGAKLQRAGSGGGGGGGRGQLPTLGRQKPQPHGWGGSLQQAWADVRQVMGITTFRIIILQVRTSPWFQTQLVNIVLWKRKIIDQCSNCLYIDEMAAAAASCLLVPDAAL